MNTCRRIVRPADWTLGLNTLFSSGKTITNRCWFPVAGPLLSRSHANVTGTKHTSASEPGQKPRLRAIDLARKIQQEKTKEKAAEPAMSPQQKRVTDLKRFSLQLQNVHPNVLAKHLHRSVLYQNQDFVVINKPYGVPVKGKSITGGVQEIVFYFIRLYTNQPQY